MSRSFGARFVVVAALVAVASTAASQPQAPVVAAQPATFSALMARFAAVPGMTARFREEKRIGLLAAPLTSEGTIAFVRPQRLVRRTTRPEASTLILDGNRLVMRDASGRQELDLQTHPAVGTLVRSFTRLLAGDRAALERAFTARYTPAADRWSVELVPRDPAVASMLTRIRAEGTAVVLQRVLVVDRGGDETETTFSQVDASHRFTRVELERLFGSRP